MTAAADIVAFWREAGPMQWFGGVIGHSVYESDRLDAELARRGVALMAPHRVTRTQRTQGGRRPR
jgi:hypothetical protein